MNDEVNAPVEEAKVPESEETSESTSGAKPRRPRNTAAHVPGPRRKRKFAERPGWDPETGTWDGYDGKAEEETVAEAPAEAEVSDEGVGPSKKFEDPMTLGSVDG